MRFKNVILLKLLERIREVKRGERTGFQFRKLIAGLLVFILTQLIFSFIKYYCYIYINGYLRTTDFIYSISNLKTTSITLLVISILLGIFTYILIPTKTTRE